MGIFDAIGTAALYAIMAGLLITAIITVVTKNIFHAAIFLAFTLLGVSFIYFFLHAEFLAGAQILLYVGAIMTLVIFAIMLTSRISDPNVQQSNRQKFPVFVIVSVLASLLIAAISKASWKTIASAQPVDAVTIGKALMGEFVFPFELISVVLLIALIGAIAIARSDE